MRRIWNFAVAYFKVTQIITAISQQQTLINMWTKWYSDLFKYKEDWLIFIREYIMLWQSITHWALTFPNYISINQRRINWIRYAHLCMVSDTYVCTLNFQLYSAWNKDKLQLIMRSLRYKDYGYVLLFRRCQYAYKQWLGCS